MELYAAADAALHDGARSLVELATSPSAVTMDYSILRTVPQDGGFGAMAVGRGQGSERAARAGQNAVSSPLMGRRLAKAGRIIFQVRGGNDLAVQDCLEAAHVIQQHAGSTPDVVGGTTIDPQAGDIVTVTILAADFGS